MPSEKTTKTFTLSQSGLGETNLNAYASTTYKKIGSTFFAAANHQFIKDVDKDGYSDVPNFQNFILHPNVFFSLNKKTKATIGYTTKGFIR